MKNGFTTKSVGTKTLSEKLQEARHKAHVSLDKLSRILNIKKSYLEAFESGDYNKLPANVYAKGYLQTLCSSLQLDFNEVFDLYQKERGIKQQIKELKEKTKPKIIKPSSIIISPRTFRIGFVILVVIALFAYLWYEFSGLSRPPKLYLIEPSQDKTITSDTLTITGQTDPEVTLTINSQPIHIDTVGNFSEKIGLQKGLNLLRIQAQNRLGKIATIERKIMVEKLKETAKSREETPKTEIKLSELEIILTVKERATWIHVETDDKVAYSGTMLPDSRQIFRAKEKIKLSSGKASATYIIFNGKDLGALKSEGDVVRDMEFTKDTVVE